MSKEKKIEDLDCNSSVILNKQGWFLLTYYQCRKDSPTCGSRDRALAKAKSISRETGIRTIEKDNYVVFEVWERW